MKTKSFFIFAHALSTSLLLAFILSPAQAQTDINIPFKYAKGQMLFDENCSACHGSNLTGSDQGPPLLHPFYKPSHHGDASFYRAALKGVKSHHWNFGDMPAVEGMSKQKMDRIIPYVRFVQKQKKLF